MAEATQPEQEGKGVFGLFGKKKEEIMPVNSNSVEQINMISRRLRVLESRITDLNRKIEVTENSMLAERKKNVNEFKANDSDVLELKGGLNDLKTKVDVIAGEFENLAPKSEIEALKKYIELWEPITFVTKEEVENIVKDMIEEKSK